MKLASLAHRLVADSEVGGTDAWAVHDAALRRVAAGDDVILLSIGQEAEESTPAPIVEAACTSLRAGRHHYVAARGDSALREAVARRQATLSGQPADPARCTVFAGAQNALFAIAQLLLETGDEVILVAPCYTTYPATFTASGARIRWVLLDRADGYAFDADRVINAITSRTRAVVLNSPNNPMGARYPADALTRVLDAVAAADAALVMDAVYSSLVEDDPGAPALAPLYASAAAGTSLITVGSLSKSHRMTGWRLGWAIAPVAFSELLGELCLAMHYGLAPFIQDAALAALSIADDTPALVRDALAARRAAARDVLVELAPVRLIDAGSGMFMLLDVEELGIDARRFAFELLDAHAVSVLPCDGFGPGGRHLVRIGLCVSPEAIGRACRAIVKHVAHYRARAATDRRRA